MRALLLSVPVAFLAVAVGCDPTGTPAPAEPGTCAEVQTAMTAELGRIQSCTQDADCGQVLTGTSCGCTRDLVARLGADTARFYDLQERQGELGCGGLISTCDCPRADGFACVNRTCSWDYSGPN
jgi:hypothetical protein